MSSQTDSRVDKSHSTQRCWVIVGEGAFTLRATRALHFLPGFRAHGAAEGQGLGAGMLLVLGGAVAGRESKEGR